MTEADMATVGITRQSIAEMLDTDAARAWCVDDDGSIIGFALALGGTREVSGLFVLADYENRGVGSMLLDTAVWWLWELGDTPIRLNVDPCTPAYHFYKRRGWTDLGFGPSEDILADDVYLEFRRSRRCCAIDA